MTKGGVEIGRRYFWLKLKKDFFENKKIKILENEKRGKDTLLFYLKLLLAAVETDGRLRYDEKRPFTTDQLAVVTQTPPLLTKRALELLQDFGFIQWEEDGTLYLPNLQEMVGSEGDSAVRMRRSREYRASHCDTDVTFCDADVTQSKRIEKEIEKEIEIESDSEKEVGVEEGQAMIARLGEYAVHLTEEQREWLKDQIGMRNLLHYAAKLTDYAIVHCIKIKDPCATIMQWYQEDHR